MNYLALKSFLKIFFKFVEKSNIGFWDLIYFTKLLNQFQLELQILLLVLLNGLQKKIFAQPRLKTRLFMCLQKLGHLFSETIGMIQKVLGHKYVCSSKQGVRERVQV